ncbi:hypothetical protein PYW07_016288 [Mythimna separata]|uniref:Envelope protein n=1 Tax=Mythimna separata TaxID=271217 RepID=A0AAD7YKC1_MYTSE|nr:hypothetical protein PYW07_016288 [Mythimna separata]
MLTFSLTWAQEINLERLDNGPGLLPFKLGPMQLITHYHTFLQNIELTHIDNNINEIRTQLNKALDRLDNYTSTLYELQLDNLHSKLNKASSHLQSLKPNRFKRGLVDGFGTVIKSITGNLDHSDAIRYDNALKALNDNQQQIVIEQNHHISLSKDLMNEHTKIITKLVENQAQLNESLHILLDADKYKKYNLIKFAKFSQILQIISNNVDSLLSELSRLENAIALSGQPRTHHSMLGTETLGNMIRKLGTIYDKNQLLDLEIREYYDIMKPLAYYNGNQIVFAFKFPITSPQKFLLYKLVIVPNKNRQAIIPSFPFLAITGNIHVYIEAECPKVASEYLCEEKLNHQMKTQPDCICDIIGGRTPEKSCSTITISLTKPAMEKLDDRRYAVVIPKATQVQLICEREESMILAGSFLATIPHNCKLRTEEFTIANMNDHIQGQPIKISNVPTETEELTMPPLKINAIDLKKLHSIQDRIESQKPIHIEPPSTIYHTTIPFYSTILAMLILGAILSYRIYIRRRRQMKIPDEATYADPETSEARKSQPASQDQSKLSTIFHLKI